MIDITLEDIAASHEDIGTSFFSNPNGLIVNAIPLQYQNSTD